MEKKTPNEKLILNDVARYKKNKLAANLALLGLVFNCLYIMLLYGIKTARVGDTVTEFATLRMGFSVILTLVLLLAGFLASEGVKGYDKRYSYVLGVLAAFQILRIFGYPMYGLKNNLLIVNYFWWNPTTSGLEFTFMLIYLVASAACFIGAGVIGWIRAVNLQNFQKQLDSGEIVVEDVLKAMDKEDEAKAATPVQSAEEVQ